jgi:DNA polymerase V
MGRRAAHHEAERDGDSTALELAEASSWVIRKHFNVVLERTAASFAVSPVHLEEFTPTKQQIICSRSFGIALRK